MPIKKGVFASSIAEVPTVTAQVASNYNQDRFTASAYVTANNSDTTVYFDYSTSPTFSSYTTVTHWVTVTGGPYYAYYNVSGLTPNTTYYYRCRAVNGVGTTIGDTNSFTTWHLITYLNSTAGSFSVSIPSITPYLDSPIAPSIYEMLIYGGGGGAWWSGGGGGGYRIASSKTSSSTGTQNVTGSIGAGGVGQSFGTVTSGGSTTLTIGNTTYTAGGGAGGNWLNNGGAVGSGDNPAYGGGTGNYGYTYISGYGQYQCGTEKNGNPIYCDDPNQPIYSTDYNRYAGGGGGGTDSAGTNCTYPDIGGNGGNGGGAYGLNGGNGGRGYGTAASGSAGSTTSGGVVVGSGGNGSGDSGLAGGVTFKYYGP